ncbi:glutamate receptor 2.3-like [Coffea eugenioides]|uniref:glutamate receptor 2.3-like n=1 Tax=Coffea eugenioides TaxID=49369 RepID=UPI000F60A953|nr:glutamate receptor 2.3-like [Coffea eugenioides]
MPKKLKHLKVHAFLLSFPQILWVLILPSQIVSAQKNTTIPVNVGVVLDMDTWIGKMGLSCISMALSDFYSSHSDYKTRIVLNNRNSKKDVVGAAAAALDLLKNTEVQAIMGPVSSVQAEFINDLGDKAHVPIISFSATSTFLSPLSSPYFIRATQNDSSQVKAISSIVKAFGWREVVPIYVDNQLGEGILPFLTDAFDKINTRIPYRSVIPSLATDEQIVAELHKLMTIQTRVFIVHLLPSLGSRLFAKAKQLGMMAAGYAWICTDAITDELNSIDPSIIDTMQGVLGVRPHVPNTAELQSFIKRWKLKFQQSNPDIVNPQLNVFGLWAYDSTTALAMAIEEAGVSNIGFDQMSDISGNTTDLESFGVSRNGPKLLQAMLGTAFQGLSGDFIIVDGQLESPVYDTVNVIGNGIIEIGFWTADKGIVRQINPITIKKLGTILWPGDTATPPKGWAIPKNGKKLRVGVPVNARFSQLVKVTRNSQTNTTMVEGYCIDIFDAVMALLPYAVPYEYVPFATSDGMSAGNYDDLAYQVYLGNFDAVAGDIAITANRSLYVDFSLAYTESGIAMIVPTDNQSRNTWIFLKPLTWDLWLTSFLAFIAIGLLIWVLEHRINDEFKGPPLHQIGMILWFSFSTMFFAHKEKIVSNLARFVLVIWFLVVFILTQSYTASLTTSLTVRQLQPTIRSVDELIKTRAYVGYQNVSFLSKILLQMGFDESRLVAYHSPEELNDLFTKGSGNGGIAAVFDEIPYMKLILGTYCSKYTMVQAAYKTDGFGFAFPIGSPLAPDVSRAILNVTQGSQILEIEKKWHLETSSCQDFNTSSTPGSLDIGSFRGLFLIMGIVAISAFIIHWTMFLYEHWNVVTNYSSSTWDKIIGLSRCFDCKDVPSHTYRKPDMRGEKTTPGGDKEVSCRPHCSGSPVTISLQASPHTNPSFSSRMEHNLTISEEHEIPSYESESPNQEGNTPQ